MRHRCSDAGGMRRRPETERTGSLAV